MSGPSENRELGWREHFPYWAKFLPSPLKDMRRKVEGWAEGMTKKREKAKKMTRGERRDGREAY